MTKEEYSKRLKSNSWKAFSRECRDSVGGQCQMCGDKSGKSVSHHMRYYNLGTTKEWADIIVLCVYCHDSYHDAHRLPPTIKRTRDFLLIEVSAALIRKGIDVSFFLNHGDSLSDHWMKSPILMAGAIAKGKRNAKRKKPKKVRSASATEKILNRRRLRDIAKAEFKRSWNPEFCRISSVDREIILNTKGLNLGSKEWLTKLGMDTKFPPAGWVKKVKRFLSDPKWQPPVER